MTNKFYRFIFLSLLASFSSSCQQKVFGVDEAVWNSLSRQERNKIIDGYNHRKEIELVNANNRRERELEIEQRRQELEAQNAPFYAAADAVSTIWGNSNGEAKSKNHSYIRIQSVASNRGRHILLIGDEQFEVSMFTKVSDAWVKGQKVELIKNENDSIYPVKIKNIDNGEFVNAKKIKK